MPTARNDVTGDLIKSKPTTDKYRENFDAIFKNRDKNRGQDRVDEPDARSIPPLADGCATEK